LSDQIDISLVVPVLNEEEAIPVFIARMDEIFATPGLDVSYEIVFVDDGSTDATAEILREHASRDGRIRMVRLSRNFGKEAALTAGLDAARGQAVIPIDVDLQDPPELIPEFIRLWRAGYDVVFGQRVDRASDSGAKRRSAGLFYRVFNRLSALKIEPNVGDFRLMARPVVEATLSLRERNRFMKGLFAWVGYRSIGVPYARPARSVGQTKFNYWKLWNLALDGLTSFSTVPLRIWTYAGLCVAAIAVIYTLVILTSTLLFGRDVPGYASLMVVVLLLGAVQIMSLGIIGEYLGRLYMETKQRPIYLVREMVGFEGETATATATEALPAPSPTTLAVTEIRPRSRRT
jgi:polyisoprenyl-phosphate glycosyltransferase